MTHHRSPAAGRSLATLLALALVALSLLTLLAAGGILLFFSFRAQERAIANSQQLMAQSASSTVSGFIHEQLNALETAVRISDADSAAPERWRRSLQSLLGLQPALKHLALLDGDGRVVAYASRGSSAAGAAFIAGLSAAQLDAMRAAPRYISPVFIDPDTSEPQVLLAVPVVDALGERRGQLVADMNLKFMWDLVDSIDAGENGYAYVVDRQGALLAFYDTARVLRGESAASVDVVRAFAAAAPGEVVDGRDSYTGLSGEHVVGAVGQLGEPDWAVVIETPEHAAYAEVVQGALLAAGVLLAMSVLAAALGIYTARRLTAPLAALTSSATRVAAGERDLQVEVRGPLEVARLADAFNSMTAQLRVTLGELEGRVARRTADLRTALDEVESRSREQARLLDENTQQRQAIRELSVPVLPVTARTLVLPLIGAVDADRLADVQDRALQAIERSAARTLLLDVTGVQVVDTQVAQGLVQLAEMARLLGAEVVLIGIRPEVAQTIVGLGIAFGELPTAADLQTALAARGR